MKAKICILGKLPPPYFGPAVATQIILNSSLKDHFKISHFDTRLNENVSDIGAWSFRKIIIIFRSHLRFTELLWKRRPNIVLVPISQSTAGFLKDSFYILLSRFFSCKIIVHLRGSNFLNWLNGSPLWVKKYTKLVLARACGAIVLGHNLTYLFRDFFDNSCIYVVPNGADHNLPAKQVRQDKVNVTYLSNFIPSKGFEDVLYALIIIKVKSASDSVLHAYGSWPDETFKQECLTLVESKGLPVQFHSGVFGTDKLNVLVNSDIFVFTPREPEGHPWVIVEALAAGLPIISTDQGAITESVIDGWNGFIVEARRPDQIAEKIIYLVEHSEERKRMGENSRKHYEAHFTEKQMVENLASVFNAVLKRK